MFISKIRIPCTIVASPIYFSTPITDVAEVLFNMCITPDEETMEITYYYELLEHYSTEKHKTANAQTSAQTATNAQTSGSVATNAQTSGSVAQTSGSVAQTSGSTATNATTKTVVTSSLKHEKKDDIPNHPLVLMVNMQAVSHNNIVSLVSLGQCHVTYPVYCKSISMCLYNGSVPCT